MCMYMPVASWYAFIHYSFEDRQYSPMLGVYMGASRLEVALTFTSCVSSEKELTSLCLSPLLSKMGIIVPNS